MIDVMLIDDDVAIRDYMRDIIHWKKLGLHLACEAGDSETARELYQLHRPKIVITDINIPIISGLDLAKEFVAADKEVRIIVITGYGDFDNVRDSVNLGAIDLLSKPIVPAEINGSLQKAIGHFEQMRRRLSTEQALSELLMENKALLQERCVARLMAYPPEGSEGKLRRQLELLSLSFPHRYFSTVLIRLEAKASGDLSGVTFSTAFKKLCDTSFSANGFRIFSHFGAVDRLDCLINYPFEQGDDRTEAVLSKLLEETRFYFQTGFSAVIGSQVEQLTELWRSAEQAQLAEHFQDDNCTGIINYRNIGKLALSQSPYSEQAMVQLLDHAQSFRRAEFQKCLTDICTSATREELQELSLEIFSRLSSICFQSGAYPWASVNYPRTVAQIFDAPDLDAIQRILLETCEQLIDTLYQQRTKSKNQLIRLAKDYIRENLGDPDLSLDRVSSQIGLSKIYFCQLFHKEEGVSFNTYLNSERISAAKTLLKKTTKKVFEISDEIGYSNPKYFNYVFKHAVGVTPLEYRKGKG